MSLVVHRDGMMEQLERFLLVASGDELTGKPPMNHHFQDIILHCGDYGMLVEKGDQLRLEVRRIATRCSVNAWM